MITGIMYIDSEEWFGKWPNDILRTETVRVGSPHMNWKLCPHKVIWGHT